MKTSVTMVRKMGEFNILQRTKDGMFNATELTKQWNKKKTKGRKDVSAFIKRDNTNEFIEALSEDLGLETRFLVSTIRGKNASTWLHPYLFIKFAMWIDPKFEVKVIRFVYDELITKRHSAGDNYILLTASGVKLKGYNFSEIATAMNWIVFNKKGKNQRQRATQEQLNELNEIQTKLSFAIDMNYIKSYQQLISEMRKIYNIKYTKF